MTILRFDKNVLANDLEMLPKNLRVVFAAACAQRLLPSYLRYATIATNANPTAVSQALANLWESVEGSPLNAASLEKHYDVCLSLIPDYDKEYVQGQEIAEDAVLAVIYGIDTQLSGDSQDAAASAESAYNSLDHYVIDKFNVDIAAPNAQLRIDSYPIMQAEFRRQRTDMADLQSAAKNSGSERAVIARIKRRAEVDSIDFFG
jgi:uncharacterized protein YjaG (DUF416 family)